jgi:hypothetical protein
VGVRGYQQAENLPHKKKKAAPHLQAALIFKKE